MLNVFDKLIENIASWKTKNIQLFGYTNILKMLYHLDLFRYLVFRPLGYQVCTQFSDISHQGKARG